MALFFPARFRCGREGLGFSFFAFALAAGVTVCAVSCKPAAIEEAKSACNGRWLRSDGGYVLEIADADSEPAVKYYNPNPINVETAKWQAAEGREGSELVVVLQDVGYPGSTYRLQHTGEADQLAGTYWQPAAGQKFPVRFVRREE